jgi:phosphoribosylformylglycinamidine synthase
LEDEFQRGLKDTGGLTLFYRVEVATKGEFFDPVGAGVVADTRDLSITSVEDVRFVKVYQVEGDLNEGEIDRIAGQLLADAVVEDFSHQGHLHMGEGLSTIEVHKKPGVMDPVEESALKAIRDLGLAADLVKTARRYLIKGNPTEAELQLIAEKVLANPTIEEVYFGQEIPQRITLGRPYDFQLVTVPIREASDEELEETSRKRQLYLSLAEMQVIKKYFTELGRDPTDAELETLAQTWSEHCVHKTFKGLIDYEGPQGKEEIDSLLATTIARATSELNKPWCISVFEDNAGIIEFDDEYGVCFKVETHNHPSAIEPYGGAGTGIGGVIRDPLGTGLGAKPIFNTDVFCFAPPDFPHAELPKGVLHPKKIMKGVVAGVRDYGNRMGIPTGNGAIYFDQRYLGNPLVYCGTIGLIPRDKCKKRLKQGDLIVVVGGRTGRDGIHGVTFASGALTEDSEMISSGAVQIGNPIMEKKMVDVLLEARDRGLYSSITDCGGGGLSSAIGEMGEELGAEVHLERVPLKYQGLSYTEIWISEAQERMLLAVPPENEKAILELFASENVEATTIGCFTGDQRLRLYYQDNEVANLSMEFLHTVPKIRRQALWQPPRHPEPDLPLKKDYGEDLRRILAAWNVCSKEWVIRQYDHEVQGASALKPLVGIENDGPGDAAIITPVLGSKKGLIISCGTNPKYSDIDPYHMAASGIDEALRQVIAVGGSLKEVGLLDNFSWGNTNKPDRLGALVRAARACYDMAIAYGTPFISGKDSLNNEYEHAGKTIVIPHTLLISAMAVMEDVTKAVSMDAKAAGDLIYLVGLTKNELGGSHYYDIHGFLGNSVPQVDAELGKKVMEALAGATDRRLVRAMHDLSEGGLAVAAAEMAFAGGLGMELDLAQVPYEDGEKRDDVILFSESNSRFLVEVSPEKRKEFEKALKGVPFGLLGEVKKEKVLKIQGLGGEVVVDEPIKALKEAWQKPLRW